MSSGSGAGWRNPCLEQHAQGLGEDERCGRGNTVVPRAGDGASLQERPVASDANPLGQRLARELGGPVPAVGDERGERQYLHQPQAVDIKHGAIERPRAEAGVRRHRPSPGELAEPSVF